jgi:hypothetical protein
VETKKTETNLISNPQYLVRVGHDERHQGQMVDVFETADEAFNDAEQLARRTGKRVGIYGLIAESMVPVETYLNSELHAQED